MLYTVYRFVVSVNNFMLNFRFLFVCFFVTTIFTPSLLTCAYQYHFITNDFKGELSGFFDKNEKIELAKNFYDTREFQIKFESWFNSSLALRGYFIRFYNQVQFTFFRINNRIVGNNNDIFEPAYIYSEIGVLPEYDFSNQENFMQLKSYVNHLELIQRKLKKYNKHLLFCITPSKGCVMYDDIPYKYKVRKKTGFESPYLYLKKLLSSKAVDYIDSRDFFYEFFSDFLYNRNPLVKAH